MRTKHKWYLRILEEMSEVLCPRCTEIAIVTDDEERKRIMREFVLEDGHE